MLNIHLNGDLVRCPDMQTIQEQAKKRRKKLGICPYNVVMRECSDWQSYCRKSSFVKNRFDMDGYFKLLNSKCILCQDISQGEPGRKVNLCQKRAERVQTGKMQKTFTIGNKEYRKITSAGHYMVKNSPHKTIFFTLTFPPFKRETNEKECNERFSRFMENLHNNYGVKHYIAVREFGEESNRIHYHCLVSCKFIDFRILNDSWNSAIQDLCYYGKNAFTTKKNKVILLDPGSAFRYCCKYFSKARYKPSTARLIFMSAPLQLKPYKRRGTNALELMHTLKETYKSFEAVRQTEYTTIFRFLDNLEFDDFCHRYLYEVFKITAGKTDFEGNLKAIGNNKDE